MSCNLRNRYSEAICQTELFDEKYLTINLRDCVRSSIKNDPSDVKEEINLFVTYIYIYIYSGLKRQRQTSNDWNKLKLRSVHSQVCIKRNKNLIKIKVFDLQRDVSYDKNNETYLAVYLQSSVPQSRVEEKKVSCIRQLVII